LIAKICAAIIFAEKRRQRHCMSEAMRLEQINFIPLMLLKIKLTNVAYKAKDAICTKDKVLATQRRCHKKQKPVFKLNLHPKHYFKTLK
jgi:hypothetical protein